MTPRFLQESLAGNRAGMNASGRARNTAAAKSSVAGPIIPRPFQITEVPKRTKVNIKAISAVVSPYSRKQSQSSTSRAEIVRPAAKAARNPLPCTDSAAAKAAKATPSE